GRVQCDSHIFLLADKPSRYSFTGNLDVVMTELHRLAVYVQPNGPFAEIGGDLVIAQRPDANVHLLHELTQTASEALEVRLRRPFDDPARSGDVLHRLDVHFVSDDVNDVLHVLPR